MYDTKTYQGEINKWGVYCFTCPAGEVLYVGHSRVGLTRLEYNHRNALSLGYTMTKFRRILAGHYPAKGTFKWLVTPYMCPEEEIEEQEGYLIRLHNTAYNVDTDPVRTAKKYGRY